MPVSPLSGQPGSLLFEHKVIGKHTARYFLDASCNYIWVESPDWLEEAYSDAIALTDTGILARNLNNIRIVSTVMHTNGLAGTRGVDLGGGYGLLVRGLRDTGIAFYWSDPYAENLMGRGFEAEDGLFDVAAAFEVLEHLPNPLAFLKEARERYGFDTLFFSANCFCPDKIPDQDWWYWAFETGQHISFFSEQCLDFMAAELGMHKVRLKNDVYAFTTRSNLRWPGMITRGLVARRVRKSSLLDQDYQKMKRRAIEEQSRS